MGLAPRTDEDDGGPLRVLVGDDDPLQLEHLALAVARLRPHWQLLRAGGAAEVAQRLADGAPRLAILDIQLGDRTALEILRGQDSAVPAILVTGNPAFAVEAFNADAIDFVLKPVRSARLERALAKAEALLRAPTRPAAAPGAAALCMLRGQAIVWAELAEVDYFLADRKYTRVMMQGGWEGLLRMGISSVEAALVGVPFRRIHRGSIVNLDRLESARRDGTGRLVVRLRGRPEGLPVSRPYEDGFAEGFR